MLLRAELMPEAGALSLTAVEATGGQPGRSLLAALDPPQRFGSRCSMCSCGSSTFSLEATPSRWCRWGRRYFIVVDASECGVIDGGIDDR